jgi:hypothetical protein
MLALKTAGPKELAADGPGPGRGSATGAADAKTQASDARTARAATWGGPYEVSVGTPGGGAASDTGAMNRAPTRHRFSGVVLPPRRTKAEGAPVGAPSVRVCPA